MGSDKQFEDLVERIQRTYLNSIDYYADKTFKRYTVEDFKLFIKLDEVLRTILSETDLPIPEDKIRSILKLELTENVEILDKLETDGFIKQDGKLRYRGTFNGRFFYYVKRGYTQQVFDDDGERRKKKTIEKLNFRLPFFAILVTIVTAGVPYAIYIASKDDVQKSSTHMPQLQKLLELQERTLKIQEQYLDSLTKILNAKSQSVAPEKK